MTPTHLTFDCYGTLVDWETGILDAVRAVFEDHGAHLPPEDEAALLARYAELEAEAEAGPWRPYRHVLGDVLEGLCRDAGFGPDPTERDALARSLPRWPLFDDTRAALERLGSRFALVIVSNVDDDLFAATAPRLGVRFDEVVTAEGAGAYKPSHRPFRMALERTGVEPGAVLHVAQSLYHDHAPAEALGWRSVRVDRPSRLAGRGLAPDVAVRPERVVCDLTSVADLLGV